MQARDLFGVALRVLGVWFLCQAGSYAVVTALKLAGGLTTSSVLMAEDKIFCGFYLLLAFVLLAGTEKIVNLFYGAGR
jgi:hypothetical protein